MFEESTKNIGVTAMAAVITKLRALDADTLEITNWASASQDQAVTWGAAAAGEVTPAETPEFEIKAGDSVAAVQFLDTDNTVRGLQTIPIGDRETFTNNGIFRATSVTLKVIDPV